jgi:hypothetical protein
MKEIEFGYPISQDYEKLERLLKENGTIIFGFGNHKLYEKYRHAIMIGRDNYGIFYLDYIGIEKWIPFKEIQDAIIFIQEINFTFIDPKPETCLDDEYERGYANGYKSGMIKGSHTGFRFAMDIHLKTEKSGKDWDNYLCSLEQI